MKQVANATCGWCNTPLHVTGTYDRRKHTVYCPPIKKTISGVEYTVHACRDADFLFRIAFADDRLEAYRRNLGGAPDDSE